MLRTVYSNNRILLNLKKTRCPGRKQWGIQRTPAKRVEHAKAVARLTRKQAKRETRIPSLGSSLAGRRLRLQSPQLVLLRRGSSVNESVLPEPCAFLSSSARVRRKKNPTPRCPRQCDLQQNSHSQLRLAEAKTRAHTHVWCLRVVANRHWG